ncbi:MAG: hypothetical protein IT337_02565 [Thermomicrobiales bacterium]|nr:hypothetical protein [Thermomicrobiales bacterium]
MDQDRFAALTRTLATAGSRRSAARIAAGLVAAALLGSIGIDIPTAEAAVESQALCRLPGAECRSRRQCCSHKCANGVCGCSPKGKTCFKNFGWTCCSKRCRRGKCR